MTLPDVRYLQLDEVKTSLSLDKYAPLSELSMEEWGQLIEERLAARDVMNFIFAQRQYPTRPEHLAAYRQYAEDDGYPPGIIPSFSDVAESREKYQDTLEDILRHLQARPLEKSNFIKQLRPKFKVVTPMLRLPEGHAHYDVGSFHVQRKFEALQHSPPSRFLKASQFKSSDWIEKKLVQYFDLRLLMDIRGKKIRDQDFQRLWGLEDNHIKWTNTKRNLPIWAAKVFTQTIASTLSGNYSKSQLQKSAL